MANFAFNITKGKIAELANRVEAGDPANSVLTLVVINTTATDAVLQDLDTLGAVIADANTAEVTNTGYSRIQMDDTAGKEITITVDDTNDRVDVDMADQTWTAVAAGDNWTDLLINYDNDSTGGTDTNILPLVQLDFVVTPDGSDITVQFNAAGFARIT